MKLLIFVSLALTALVSSTLVESDSEVVYSRGNVDIKTLASLICSDRKDSELIHPRTILRLASFLDSNTIPCSEDLKESVYLFNIIIESSPDYPCSSEKIALVESFHKKYLNKNADAKIPEAIKIFFNRYAIELSAACKLTIIKNIIDNRNEKIAELEKSFGAAFGKLGALLAGQFGEINSAKDYDDVVPVWDFLKENFVSKHLEHLRNYIDANGFEANNESPVISVKVKEPNAMRLLQDQCRYKLKPVYGKLILPVMRLTKLGYSAKSESMIGRLEEFRANQEISRWFTIAQLCELVLPVDVYPDPSLSNEGLVVVDRVEAQKLNRLEKAVESEVEKVEIDLQPASMVADLLKVDDKVIEDSIKHTLEVQRKTNKRLLKKVASRFRKSLKDKVKSFFLSSHKTSEKAPIEEFVEPPSAFLSDEEMLRKLEAGLNAPMTVNKKVEPKWKKWLTGTGCVGIGIAVVVLAPVVMVILSALSPFLLIGSVAYVVYNLMHH